MYNINNQSKVFDLVSENVLKLNDSTKAQIVLCESQPVWSNLSEIATLNLKIKTYGQSSSNEIHINDFFYYHLLKHCHLLCFYRSEKKLAGEKCLLENIVMSWH